MVGLSLGGWIATDFSIAYPERVHDTVLVDPYYPLPEKDVFEARIREYVSIARHGTLADGLNHWLNDPLFEPARERVDLKSKLTEIVLGGHAAKGEGAMFVNVDKEGRSRRLEGKTPKDIRCRVLCLVGKRDIPRFHAVVAHLSQTIPDVECASVPDAGHMANMENPEFVLTQISRFLKH